MSTAVESILSPDALAAVSIPSDAHTPPGKLMFPRSRQGPQFCFKAVNLYPFSLFRATVDPLHINFGRASAKEATDMLQISPPVGRCACGVDFNLEGATHSAE